MSEIITSSDLDPSNYIELMPLDQKAIAQTETDIANQWRDSASRGEAFWYEITSHLSGGGLSIQDKFSRELLDGHRVAADIPSNAIESEIRLLSIDEVRKRIELDGMYDSYFDKTGSFAKLTMIINTET